MSSQKQFFVWKRNDGYVGATAYRPRDYPPSMTFEILGVFDKWDTKIVDYIIERRQNG